MITVFIWLLVVEASCVKLIMFSIKNSISLF
nr:MAG TPA: hypothetical protein [Caudoviricetes sp.]